MKNKRFKSVWDAIERTPEEAANLKARSELTMAIRSAVDSWKVSQVEASKKLGVTQPRLNDLLRGRIDKFSLDALVLLAAKAGLKVTLKVARRAA